MSSILLASFEYSTLIKNSIVLTSSPIQISPTLMHPTVVQCSKNQSISIIINYFWKTVWGKP